MTATTGIWQPHDRAPGETRDLRLHAGATELTATAAAELTWTVTEDAEGVHEVRITPDRPASVRVAWRVPCLAATAFWAPDGGEHRGLPPFWRKPRVAALEKNAPVGCLVGAGDVSLCTYAVGEVVRPVHIRTGVVEESGDFGFWAEHDAEPGTGLVLRLDLTGRPFARTLADVAAWWRGNARERTDVAEGWRGNARERTDVAEGWRGNARERTDVAEGWRGPAEEVPEVARMPAYSTWYAMQQHVDAASVERQAGPAAELGCEAIIVDDGWHSDDRGRGYGHVGEWEPSATSFPDISGHVAAVKQAGLAYLLWYALPFVGRHTALWDRVQPYSLAYKEHMNAVIVDPRYPHIRELLAGHLTRAVREWGMDGFWLGFVKEHADVLQRGAFEPARPDLVYPQVTARGEETVITARYAPLPVAVPATGTLWLANADASPDVLLQVADPGMAHATVTDCRGRTVSSAALDLAPGPHAITIPTGGLLHLRRAS
ncbi:alpha-galactosidase [Nonomuraea sp. NPDC050680]|uniref:alpha-galactosidase n=1 Tax=Nonomuraea sp. NPDC050680 TaxID=3154630 RepID=UPI00340BCEB2